MDLNQAAVFVKVVQAGSFNAAARLLGLPCVLAPKFDQKAVVMRV